MRSGNSLTLFVSMFGRPVLLMSVRAAVWRPPFCQSSRRRPAPLASAAKAATWTDEFYRPPTQDNSPATGPASTLRRYGKPFAQAPSSAGRRFKTRSYYACLTFTGGLNDANELTPRQVLAPRPVLDLRIPPRALHNGVAPFAEGHEAPSRRGHSPLWFAR